MPDIISPDTLSNGLKIASGVHTTVAASDSIDTGLRQVNNIVVSLQDDPGDATLLASALPGVDGAATIKTWKTDGSDPTPAAATSFGKKVAWVAIGY